MNQPPREHLRFYGLSIAAAMSLAGWLVFQTTGQAYVGGAVASVGVIFGCVFYAIPKWQTPMVEGFDRATFPIRWVLSLAALTLVYYLVVTPIAFWFRWSGRSIRRVDDKAESNWQELRLDDDPESYFRTY